MKSKILKAVIPVAGLGTRLIPITKEFPKELLPIFVKTKERILVKPVLQVIFEQLYDVGIHTFCFIVGRTKRAIEDYFTPDYNFLKLLDEKTKEDISITLKEFYKRIENSIIVFINQPRPLGFGDAILKARPFVGDSNFLVHAGDDIIFSKNQNHLRRLEKTFSEYNANVVFLVNRVKKPQFYGVIVGEEVDNGIFKINKIIEKPQDPPSNIAVIAVYLFDKTIFDALTSINYDKNKELQLTDAIQYLVREKKRIFGVMLNEDEKRIDVGTVGSYYNSLKEIFNNNTITN